MELVPDMRRKDGWRKAVGVMADTIKLVASIEWLALGIIVYWLLKKWDRRFSDLYKEMKEDMERWRESDETD